MLQYAIPQAKSSGQLSSGAMLLFVALLAAFPMLSTDMYLPAIPSIREDLNTTVELVNMTLVVFFIFLSASMLIYGPLSDRFGRKPVLLFGVGLYFISSVACFLSGNIYVLIVCRIFQAVGSGAGMGTATAIVKDFFPPGKMMKAFALISALTGIVPIIAPSIGALLLNWMDWRGAFAAFSLVGLASFIFVLFFKETHLYRSTDSIPASVFRLFVVLKNPSFARLFVLFSLPSFAFLAYVGVSSILYIQEFGLTEQQFGFYFATSAFASVAGSFAYIYLAKLFKPMNIITGGYVTTLISAAMLIWIGGRHPMFLLLSISIGVLGFSIQRPPSTSLILEQQERDSGSASSLIASLVMLVGSSGLYFISLEWENRIFVLGMMLASTSICGFLLWLYAKRRCRIPQNFLDNRIEREADRYV